MLGNLMAGGQRHSVQRLLIFESTDHSQFQERFPNNLLIDTSPFQSRRDAVQAQF
jgi:hypothetical protein